MQSITFAVPTLGTAAMTRQDQIDVVTNQAVAAIVCCYLEHMNAAIAKATGPIAPDAVAFLSRTELTALINEVQGVLRTIP